LIDRDLNHIHTKLSIQESVEVITGDQYCTARSIDYIDYLKMDVEGWEMQVLGGFERMFANQRIGACQFEFGHAHIERRETFRDFFTWFKRNGYLLHIIKPNGDIYAIGRYAEIFENYYASNYLALSESGSEPRWRH
jgi:hypothetical protein